MIQRKQLISTFARETLHLTQITYFVALHNSRASSYIFFGFDKYVILCGKIDFLIFIIQGLRYISNLFFLDISIEERIIINSYSNEFFQITELTMAARIPDGIQGKR